MFKNKTVIVTGGANGIGRATAYAFAAKGANTIIVDMKEEGRTVVQEWKQSGYNAAFYCADVGNTDKMAELFAQINQEYGGIDILINNAGVSSFGSIWDIKKTDWDKIMTTNAASVLFCSREAARYMKSGSAIVNMCSTRQSMSEPHTELYAASKGAIYSLTHALSVTLGEKGIRVNSISPGWIETGDYTKLRPEDHGQHPAGRVGRPEDVAKACLYLTDPENTFVTGENLVIDGGMTRKMIYVH
ncbi:SDR family oxidoreductase [Domibacillus sp. DTU_2020_1001157_1_SI_ALB_TIR_016]|uniref:SDR family NAD(P)-dependent oxidoreductase n=1 Tax=Domibacillus sp. DTU_2020_1001157_1_SI_ALB_TIR_016 TaxID=3077789 RepID=UPI0028EF4798|nr:SDR family oxidoreductase [Domibacillus sp. DTU_2020_1001157_1_SI_ALB_TIR_016]WNS79883.1 SDR family oxidoreductase [Domibacillus sp. DTU_2020_1001157_1_SI_ALB_TIR_016]